MQFILQVRHRSRTFGVHYIDISSNAEKLWNQRKSKIERIDNKINNAKLKTQQMTPKYIDVLIGLYERKSTHKGISAGQV